MRELRGAIIDEFDPGAAKQPGALPVEVARDMLRAVIDQQMTSARASLAVLCGLVAANMAIFLRLT